MSKIDFFKFKLIISNYYRAYENFKVKYPIIINAIDHNNAVTEKELEWLVPEYFCGYVGVSQDHPLYEINFMDETIRNNNIGLDVNGGLTFSDYGCNVCGKAGEFDKYWFFGFDCAHDFNREFPCSLESVINDCKNLANQLKTYKLKKR